MRTHYKRILSKLTNRIQSAFQLQPVIIAVDEHYNKDTKLKCDYRGLFSIISTFDHLDYKSDYNAIYQSAYKRIGGSNP